MNLELLNPFRRQIPDRVIATLTLPPALHGMARPYGSGGASGSNGNGNGNGNSNANSKSADDTHSVAPTSTSGSAVAVSSATSSSHKKSAAAAALMLEEEEWKAVYHVAFNRRGSYVAVGYASGTVAVFDVQSRTLAALYRDTTTASTISSTAGTSSSNSKASTTAASKKVVLGNGVTSVTWSRRSRTLLAGAVGDAHVRLMDTTHPNGPEECCLSPSTTAIAPSSVTATTTTAATTIQQPSSHDGTAAATSATATLLADDSIKESSLVDENDAYWASLSAAGNPAAVVMKNNMTKSSLVIPDQSCDYVAQARHLLVERSRSETSKSRVGTKSPIQTEPVATDAPGVVTIEPNHRKRIRRYPTLVFSFPHPVGGSLQVHPREKSAGLAVLSNGSLVVFWAPPWAWEEEVILEEEIVPTVASEYHGFNGGQKASRKRSVRRRSDSTANEDDNNENEEEDYDDDKDDGEDVVFQEGEQPFESLASEPMQHGSKKRKAPVSSSHARQQPRTNTAKSSPTNARTTDDNTAKVKLVTIWQQNHQFVTCAAFDPQGERIYAASKDGTLLGFDVKQVFERLKATCQKTSIQTASSTEATDGSLAAATAPRNVSASFRIPIPGGSTAWHLIVSRNGRTLVINSADGALRLYSTAECWSTPELVERPNLVFQDIVSKVKFASCDISGDGEYVVGGANGNVDNQYELYIWNTTTGALLDKLTGPPVQLYSVAWHPTRSFLAVAASDGMVDVWGPPINWTAFAPDFQALPANVEYVEREDEFDIVVRVADAAGVHDATKADQQKMNDNNDFDEQHPFPPNKTNLEESSSAGGFDVPITDDDQKEDKGVELDSSDDHGIYVGHERFNNEHKDNDAAKHESMIVVDVVTVEPVPVFASDSEEEEEVFTFGNKVMNVVRGGALRGRGKRDMDDS